MTNPMENELIRLRALEPDDVQVLYKWENDTEVWKVSNTIVPFSKYMLLQFIANQQRDIFETRQLRLIIESKQSGKPVGAIDLFDLDPYNCRAGVGILIYDNPSQDTHAGGSGCGCSAVVLASYILPKVVSGEWKRILFVPTGALLSKVSFNEGDSIPGIAHGVVIEHMEV